MTDLNEIISEYMTKRGVKDEHFITPNGWKEIAVLFAKEASKEQRLICSESAQMLISQNDKEPSTANTWSHNVNPNKCNYKASIYKESILNAKSPV